MSRLKKRKSAAGSLLETAKNKPGRPATRPPHKKQTYSLSISVIEMIDSLAEAERVKKFEIIEKAVLEYAERSRGDNE